VAAAAGFSKLKINDVVEAWMLILTYYNSYYPKSQIRHHLPKNTKDFEKS